MTIERARVRAQPKPWGVVDLRPWSAVDYDDAPVGELSSERANDGSASPALLVKLLFSSAALSIQVHPDDAYATTKGMPNGKSEAWYVLSVVAQSEAVALQAGRMGADSLVAYTGADGVVPNLLQLIGPQVRDTVTVAAAPKRPTAHIGVRQ